MREKYGILYEMNIKKQGRDMILTKKLRGIQNDVLTEKIVLEKARMDETDELNKLQHVENERDKMQKVRVLVMIYIYIIFHDNLYCCDD